MPTTNPVPSTDPNDLLFNAGKLDEVVNGAGSTYTDRLGVTRRTLGGIDAEAETRMDAIDAAAIAQRDNIQDAADLVLAAAGYAPPVAYAAGISLTLQTQTVSYNGDTYAPKQADLPFTTSGTFETAKFRLIQGVASADLPALVGQDLQDYAALRAYTGLAKRVYITGLLVTAKPAGIAGVFQYDPTDTTSADNGGTIIVGADGRRWKRDYSGALNVFWFMTPYEVADVQSGLATLDVTNALKSAISATPFGAELETPPGNYKFSDTLAFFQSIAFGGTGSNMARWNQNLSCVTFTWAGDATKPAIEIGGTASSVLESYRIAHGIRLKNFFLRPATVGGGQDGIMIDGSNTRYASRGYCADIILDGVAVRNFGRNEVRAQGNVFDVRIFSSVLHTVANEGLKLVDASSNYTVTWPTQIYSYDTYYRGSNVAGTWGIDCGSSSDIHLFGGGVASFNGTKLGVGSSVWGTHYEGLKGTGSVGAWFLRTGINFNPHIMDSYKTLIRLGETGSSTAVSNYTISCQGFYNADVGIEVTAGGGRSGTLMLPSFDPSVITPYLDSRGLGDLRVVNTGFNPALDGINIQRNALIFGNNEKEFVLQYVLADLALKMTTLNSGGSPTLRLSIARRQDLQEWVWSATRHKFNRAAIGSSITASRPVSPTIGEMWFDTTLNKPIWHNGAVWVDATGTTV